MNYELIYILTPKLSEEEVKSKAKEISGLLKKAEAEVAKEDFWGKRELAYPIKHFEEGWYVLCEFSSEPEKIKEIDKALKLQEEIIRFLIVKREEKKVIKEKEISKEPKKIEKVRPESDSPTKESESEVDRTDTEVGVEKPAPSKVRPEPSRRIERPEVAPEKKKVDLEELDKKLEKILGEETEI